MPKPTKLQLVCEIRESLGMKDTFYGAMQPHEFRYVRVNTLELLHKAITKKENSNA